MGSTIVASKTSLEKAIRLAWLDDLNTFGEDSYVYNNDEKLKALFGMKADTAISLQLEAPARLMKMSAAAIRVGIL